MDECSMIREALSARLDGEDAGLASSVVDGHLRSCVACRTWFAAAEDVHRAVRLTPMPFLADRTSEILAAAGDDARRDELRPWQGALVAVAVIQLVLAGPAFLLSTHAGSAHAAHELGSWDVALAVGFLFAAVRPARAWGLVPLVAALVLCLVVTSVLDVAAGRAAALSESNHLLEAMGLYFLWTLARTVQRPLGRSRLTVA